MKHITLWRVRIKRAFIACHKIALVFAFVCQTLLATIPYLKPAWRTLWSQKRSLKKTKKALSRALLLKSLSQKFEKNQKAPTSYFTIALQHKKDFNDLYESFSKKKEVELSIVNQQTELVARLCTHPFLVLSSYCFDNPWVYYLLALSLKHNNKTCEKMLLTNTWPFLCQSSLFRMKLAMGLPKETKKFFKKTKAIYQNPEEAYGYTILLSLSGNFATLKRFIERAPWYNDLPASIKDLLSQQKTPNIPDINIPASFKTLFGYEWCHMTYWTIKPIQENLSLLLSAQNQCEISEQWYTILSALPQWDYEWINKTLAKAVKQNDMASVRLTLNKLPTDYDISMLTTSNAVDLLGLLHSNFLTPQDFKNLKPFVFSWPRTLANLFSPQSMSLDHLALSYLAFPNHPKISTKKHVLLEKPLCDLSRGFIQMHQTRSLLQREVNDILEAKPSTLPAQKRRM